MCGDWCIRSCKGGQISIQSVYPLWDAQHLFDIVSSKGMEYGTISFLLQTQDGEVLKLRSIYSWSHDQALFLKNVLSIQEKATSPFLLWVRYCRYSKALVDIQVVGYPSELKRRTLEYVMNGFRNITRWTAKKS